MSEESPIHHDSNECQTVVFRLAEESYGIDIFRVNEIIRVPRITPVPQTSDNVLGLVNLRGKTIPVIDLRSRFDLPAESESEASRIIVVDSEEGQVGMMVDAVTEVVSLFQEDIESTPVMVSDQQTEFVRGIAKRQNRLITLLDLDKTIAA